MSGTPTPEETALWQRRFASQANNRAWSLSEQRSRTGAEDEEMLQAAHAAKYFWSIVGNEKNRAHAAQLLALVYSKLGWPLPASHYLSRSEPILLSDQAEPWERSLAHAVAASVAEAIGDSTAHRAHFREATEQVAALSDPEDRAIIEATLKVLPRPEE